MILLLQPNNFVIIETSMIKQGVKHEQLSVPTHNVKC